MLYGMNERRKAQERKINAIGRQLNYLAGRDQEAHARQLEIYSQQIAQMEQLRVLAHSALDEEFDKILDKFDNKYGWHGKDV